MKLNERIEAIIRAWPDWSRHELENLDPIIEDILDHCRNGGHTGFIKHWCDNVLPPGLDFDHPSLTAAERNSGTRI